MAYLRTGSLRIFTYVDLNAFNATNETHGHNRPIESVRIGSSLWSAEKIS